MSHQGRWPLPVGRLASHRQLIRLESPIGWRFRRIPAEPTNMQELLEVPPERRMEIPKLTAGAIDDLRDGFTCLVLVSADSLSLPCG